ncbi:MAG TPA: type I-E CRISPR-associated endoribonuclease Cas2e [Thermomicrobiales bacterium]|nr:type I-E CRISPR-associated endoribonuclease Cas2e [Thermomicrobiales bacterium]
MIVLILEKVPASLRGELTRWFVEPRTGVFVGRVSGQVRDLIWELVCDRLGGGGGIMIHPMNNEQGFEIRSHGETRSALRDFEGLTLFRKALNPREEALVAKEARSLAWAQGEEPM